MQVDSSSWFIPKIDKKRLRSSFRDKILIEIDLKSCEPNFYLKAMVFHRGPASKQYVESKLFQND